MLRPPPFPISIDELTTEVLTEAVGAEVAGFTATRIGADRGMLGEIHLVELDYGRPGAGPDRVVAKFAALRDGSLASARRGGTHERELRCYHELLASTPVNAPRFHAAWYDPDTAHFLLVQDAVDADTTIDQLDGLDVGRARVVLAEVARCHARWWGDDTLHHLAWLPALDAQQRRHNLTTLAGAGWEPLCALVGDELSPAERALGPGLADRVDAVLCELATLPGTLLHGDLRTDNLLFSPDGSAVSLVDWQGAGVGPVGWDLAYFLSQCLSVADRRAHEADLLDHYRDQLAVAGRPVPESDVVAGYGRAMVFGLVIACALPLIAEPGEARVPRLAATAARRAIEGLRDHGQLWIEEEP